MALSALVLNIKDNVATAVRPLESGDTVAVEIDGNPDSVTLLQAVPFGHKIALKDVGTGENIIKYGETIGQAMAAIRKGEHVHVHNVEGFRGRGDKQ